VIRERKFCRFCRDTRGDRSVLLVVSVERFFSAIKGGRRRTPGRAMASSQGGEVPGELQSSRINHQDSKALRKHQEISGEEAVIDDAEIHLLSPCLVLFFVSSCLGGEALKHVSCRSWRPGRLIFLTLQFPWGKSCLVCRSTSNEPIMDARSLS